MNKKQGIVIVTSEATKDFLDESIYSCLQTKYPILVVSNLNYSPEIKYDEVKLIVNDWNGYELGGIERGMEEFDEFILLHDTVIIKDQKLFDLCFEFDGSVGLTKDLAYSYCGKFRTEILQQMSLPRVYSYQEAVDQERPFGVKYLEIEKKYMEIEPLGAGDHSIPLVERHGRQGIILSNNYLEKHKSHF
jgi:hypothetical protein